MYLAGAGSMWKWQWTTLRVPLHHQDIVHMIVDFHMVITELLDGNWVNMDNKMYKIKIYT
jgi:hypothetical protein